MKIKHFSSNSKAEVIINESDINDSEMKLKSLGKKPGGIIGSIIDHNISI